MCRAAEDGGQRCASHTRPAYETATFGTPEWDKAAAEFASTPTGHEELSGEWFQACRAIEALRARRTLAGRLRKEDRAAYIEATTRLAALDNALDRGSQIRLSNLTAAETFEPRVGPHRWR